MEALTDVSRLARPKTHEGPVETSPHNERCISFTSPMLPQGAGYGRISSLSPTLELSKNSLIPTSSTLSPETLPTSASRWKPLGGSIARLCPQIYCEAQTARHVSLEASDEALTSKAASATDKDKLNLERRSPLRLRKLRNLHPMCPSASPRRHYPGRVMRV